MFIFQNIKMVSSRIILVFFLAIVATALATKHDMIIGIRQIGDREFIREKIYKAPSKWGFKHQVIEKEFRSPYIRTITMIRALDQNTSGHGAEVTVTGGGVGYDYVKLKFESETFRGIDFYLEIYGR